VSDKYFFTDNFVKSKSDSRSEKECACATTDHVLIVLKTMRKHEKLWLLRVC
jgi:hypothetical protein